MTDMTPERAAQFLRDMAQHLENQAARSKEDIVFWANTYNAKTCNKIADMLCAPTLEEAE